MEREHFNHVQCSNDHKVAGLVNSSNDYQLLEIFKNNMDTQLSPGYIQYLDNDTIMGLYKTKHPGE